MLDDITTSILLREKANDSTLKKILRDDEQANYNEANTHFFIRRLKVCHPTLASPKNAQDWKGDT